MSPATGTGLDGWVLVGVWIAIAILFAVGLSVVVAIRRIRYGGAAIVALLLGTAGAVVAVLVVYPGWLFALPLALLLGEVAGGRSRVSVAPN